MVDFPDVGITGRPFRERAGPHSALTSLDLLDGGVGTEPSYGSYYRVKNSYSGQSGRLEYAVILMADEVDDQTKPQPGPAMSGEILLGTLTLRGSGTGTARLAADAAGPTASKLVMQAFSGELYAVELSFRESLARINVGPHTEKVRLEGQIWSDVPVRQNSYQPFTRSFSIDVRAQGSFPLRQGGASVPLATFSNLQADDNGFFAIKDLPLELVPEGVYDLRVVGAGTMPYLHKNVRIESTAHQTGGSPQVVNVALGPLRSGDLNGDNAVNGDDLSWLASNFGKEVREFGPGVLADLNNDGVVDGQDFSLLAANYGQQGE